jgi:hypothetical protein
MRQGETGCGSILAGGGGWASSPTEAGGYWSAPSSSAPTASPPFMQRAATSKLSNLSSLFMFNGRAPRLAVNPGQLPEGSTRSPLGRPASSGLSAGDHSNPRLRCTTVYLRLTRVGAPQKPIFVTRDGPEADARIQEPTYPLAPNHIQKASKLSITSRRSLALNSEAQHPRHLAGAELQLLSGVRWLMASTGWAAMNNAELPAMNNAEQPSPETYRELAAKLRELADQSHLPEIRGDLLDLSARFERMAAYFEAQRRPRSRSL